MKVFLSTAKRIKEHYPNFRDWERAMVERYGDGITSKTNEIWNLIDVNEKTKAQETISNPEFMNDALKFRKRFDDYYKWQVALMQKYGAGIQTELYSVWMETKEKLIEESKTEYEIASKEKECISDEDLILNKILFWLKITSIVLLIFSLMKLPIGYYTFLRITVCGTSIFSAYTYYQTHKNVWVWLFGVVGVIFNPFIPLYLGKPVWAGIDIFTALIFFVSIIVQKEFPYRKIKY